MNQSIKQNKTTQPSLYRISLIFMLKSSASFPEVILFDNGESQNLEAVTIIPSCCCIDMMVQNYKYHFLPPHGNSTLSRYFGEALNRGVR